MTKAVRIENSDTNNSVKVVVEVWDGGKLTTTQELLNPTDMTSGLYLTDTRHLVVKEVKKE